MMRTQRVAAEMRRLLAEHLVTGMSRPIPCLASISDVIVHPNLRHAQVFFRLVGDESQTTEATQILDEQRARFQRLVARDLKLKFCPVLNFEYGKAPALDPIDELLSQLTRRQRGE
jgi:ribosome-binding factor A